MLDGKVLAIRFFFEGGNFADATFDLFGAGNAIGPALKIETSADPNIVAHARDRDEAVIISTTVCQSSPDLSACLGVMTNCMGANPSQLTGEQMRSCMAEHGYPLEPLATKKVGTMPQAKADAILTKNCTALGGLARSIMDKRQGGVDMSQIMSAIESISNEEFKPVARSMVIMAYNTPRWNGEELKQQAISDFSNQVQVACYQGNTP
ncbi:hypothetical protein [Mesorhizobium argentiipisi]|uniref:DUF4476 domain-containing protein n=1 Tax=Mesorhizobium argentiipisi TaxID=3015175 RepID=A0ABU8KMA3_9HYPH